MAALERRHRARQVPGTGRRPVQIPGGMATVPVAGALLFSAFAGFETYQQVELAREGAEAPATVVKRWTGNKNTDYADVVFTTSTGRQVRTSVSQDHWRDMPAVGAKVRIRYASDRPANATDARMVTGERAPILVVLWGFALIFGITGFLAWRKGRRG